MHPSRLIYVTPTVVAAVAGADGRYVLDGVPAGCRRFTVWHHEKGIVDRELISWKARHHLDIEFPAAKTPPKALPAWPDLLPFYMVLFTGACSVPFLWLVKDDAEDAGRRPPGRSFG